MIATSALASVECRGALARLERSGALSPRDRRERTRHLERLWNDIFVIDVDTEVIEAAGRLIHQHVLRTIDAIHLASALTWVEADRDSASFACWDRRLWDAARAERFVTVPDARP